MQAGGDRFLNLAAEGSRAVVQDAVVGGVARPGASEADRARTSAAAPTAPTTVACPLAPVAAMGRRGGVIRWLRLANQGGHLSITERRQVLR